MRKRFLAALAVAAALATVGCATWNGPSERNRFASDEPSAGGRALGGTRTDDAPLTVSVRTGGMFAHGHAWDLTVSPAGQAELTVHTHTSVRKQFQVPKTQWAEFRTTLADARFFELKGEYGEQVPCGSVDTITVSDGRRTHTVNLYHLRDSTPADKAELREASRAVRLLVLVRGWFDDAEAVDRRKDDQAVLDAARE